MSTKVLRQEILLYEGAGFALVLAVLWLNEVLDLPHRFLGGVPTPVNWREGILESLVVVILALATLTWTARILARVRYLEGLMRVCMFCKRVHAEDNWIPIEVYVLDHSEAVVSHGMCPQCEKQQYVEMAKEN